MRIAAGLALALLGGCVSAAPERPGVAPRVPIPTAGLERVMGQTEAGLTRLLGRPDAEFSEGTARKLQFAGAICVMDAYLYPDGLRPPVVTYLDTRQRDGSPIDRASCLAALTRRTGGK